MFWKRKRLSEDFVELSIGKIYFYQITKRIVDKAERNSIVNHEVKSVPLYFQTIEQEIVSLSKSQLDDLSIEDTQKLRLKIKEVLIKNKLFVEEKTEEKPEFDSQEIEWFDRQKFNHLQKLGGK